jgi:hypothetical protein
MARLTIELSDNDSHVLETLRRETGETKLTVLKKALWLYNAIRREKGNGDLAITGRDGRIIKRLVIV